MRVELSNFRTLYSTVTKRVTTEAECETCGEVLDPTHRSADAHAYANPGHRVRTVRRESDLRSTERLDGWPVIQTCSYDMREAANA